MKMRCSLNESRSREKNQSASLSARRKCEVSAPPGSALSGVSVCSSPPAAASSTTVDGRLPSAAYKLLQKIV